jgi:bifunctional non-homologous end joining protein LigD
MPRNVKPMLATPTPEPFDDPNWLFEIKWDGYRGIAEVEAGKVRLYSRNQLSFDKQYAPIVDSLKHLGHDALLDGEVVVLDAAGKPSFDLLQNYARTRCGSLVYYVFDLLYLDGHDLRGLPLLCRKALLGAMLPNLPNVRVSEYIEGHGRHFFQVVAERQLEGIVAKDARSRYLTGRRGDAWRKIKARLRQQVVIGGFTEPKGRRSGLGSLLLGVYQGADLVYVGHAGTGFSDAMLAELQDRLRPFVQDQSPFQRRPKSNGPAHWLRPELVCEVAFTAWTADRHLRHAVFLGLRPGVLATGVAIERASQPGNAAGSGLERKAVDRIELPKPKGGPIGVDGRVVSLTNLDKVYWPEDGYTKRDLLEYYADVADVIVPYLKDRPLSLLRHPNGIRGASFFQKDVTAQSPPEWAQTVRLRSESGEKEKQWILCQDRATLLYLANLGCIELNPWNARVGALDQADYLLLDLDPEDVPFPDVVRVAQEARRVLNQIGAVGYCKTSGKRGLHIYVPLGGRYNHEHAKQFAQLLAYLVHARLPHLTSLVRDPRKRQQRVYLDYLQNGQGKTLAAAYSVRPVPGACVSTPLAWKELGRRLDPSRFTLKTLARRLDKVGDLWAGVLGPGIDLAACLQRITSLSAR